MKLTLSGRLWETSQGPTVPLTQQIQFAAELGYSGFEIRYPLLPARCDWEVIRESLRRHQIELVFAAAAGVPDTPAREADFIRVLDTIQFLGGRYIKQIPFQEADITVMRRGADWGAQRGIKVLTQYHANSLTDTVEKTERFFATAHHPNLGLIFDACHLPFSEPTSIQEAARRLRPWIDLLNLQSYKPAREGDGMRHVTINGLDWSPALPSDPDGTDLEGTMRILRELGYDGPAVVMPAVDPSMDPLAVARNYREFLVGN